MSYPQANKVIHRLSTGGRIGLKPGTQSYKAYSNGVKAFDLGLGEDSCPYLTSKVQMLRSWWMIGYHELDNKRLHAVKYLNTID